jgi:hypothetical protein
MHNLWHVFHDTELDLIAFILEEVVNDFEEVLLGFLLTYDFSDFMKTFT